VSFFQHNLPRATEKQEKRLTRISPGEPLLFRYLNSLTPEAQAIAKIYDTVRIPAL
jgi:hypothetical protein